jgi:hypothetical protein
VCNNTPRNVVLAPVIFGHDASTFGQDMEILLGKIGCGGMSLKNTEQETAKLRECKIF